MRWLAGAAASLILGSIATAQEPPSGSAVHIIRNPDWARRPTAEEVMRHYPEAARRLGVSGRGVIACTVALDGRLEDCEAIAATPAGYGFGEAALAVAQYVRMTPQTMDGAPRAGARIRLPIVFGAPRKRGVR
ncbi:TonB family protein [Phenylobacterium sp.]|uniref:TonB family protein n=1 Tax=Phenylobacterium sp. TaxID=1871053 RepID=UPI0025E638ED|nr:TonB family protein [Phenylobacterium sp.]